MKHDKSGSGKIPFEDPSAAGLRALRGHLDLDEIEAALGVYQNARERLPGWRPPPSEWMNLIKGLLARQAWESVIPVMENYVAEVDAPSPRVRLKLGQLLILRQSRPARGLRVLAAIPGGTLPPPLEGLLGQLRRQAEQMREEGPPELEDPD